MHDALKKWEAEHQNMLSSSIEANLIVYFKELQSRLKPPTLWSIWSMLKKTLNTHDNVDISHFLNLKCLLSNNSKGYKPKKSAVLKWQEIEKFLKEAMDFIYLASKVYNFSNVDIHNLKINIFLQNFFVTFFGDIDFWNMWSFKMR